MTELEEHLMRNGFQELDETDSGVSLRGRRDAQHEVLVEDREAGPPRGQARRSQPRLHARQQRHSGGPSLGGAIGLLTGSSPGSAPPIDPGSGVGDISKTLAAANAGDPSALAGAAAGGVGGIASMVMGLVYPSLKLIFEASTRRITVTLTWREGPKSFTTNLVQWMASPQRAGVTGEDADAGTSDTPGPKDPKDKAKNPPR